MKENYRIHKLDNVTVDIKGENFYFCYTIADKVVKKEYIGQYRYFGGLQTDLEEGSEDYIKLEEKLCQIAEKALGIKWVKDERKQRE